MFLTIKELTQTPSKKSTSNNLRRRNYAGIHLESSGVILWKNKGMAFVTYLPDSPLLSSWADHGFKINEG